jgi:NADPH2:quinone reductase
MRYVRLRQPGEADQLEISQAETPEPRSGEVLIRVAAAGINRPDLLQRQGNYPPPAGASPILGLEVSGWIEKIGPETQTHFQVGDVVCALLAGGGYAEYCIAPVVQCLPVPAGVSIQDAAGIPETFFTVWSNVFERGRLVNGEKFLVHGGTSGIGTTAIQLAKAFGATVFTTAGSDEKCSECLKLGADYAFNYKKTDFVQAIQATGKSPDLILDMVGGPYFEKNIEVLSQNGRLVQIATLQGSHVQANLRLIMSKGILVTGSTLRPKSPEQKGQIARQLLEKVWPLFGKQLLKVKVDRTFPLEDVADAHRLMESSQHVGKILLIVNSERRDPT